MGLKDDPSKRTRRGFFQAGLESLRQNALESARALFEAKEELSAELSEAPEQSIELKRVRILESLELGQSVTLDDMQAYHMQLVLRPEVGMPLHVMDLNDQLWAARIIQKEPLILHIESHVRIEGRSSS